MLLCENNTWRVVQELPHAMEQTVEPFPMTGAVVCGNDPHQRCPVLGRAGMMILLDLAPGRLAVRAMAHAAPNA